MISAFNIDLQILLYLRQALNYQILSKMIILHFKMIIMIKIRIKNMKVIISQKFSKLRERHF